MSVTETGEKIGLLGVTREGQYRLIVARGNGDYGVERISSTGTTLYSTADEPKVDRRGIIQHWDRNTLLQNRDQLNSVAYQRLIKAWASNRWNAFVRNEPWFLDLLKTGSLRLFPDTEETRAVAAIAARLKNNPWVEAGVEQPEGDNMLATLADLPRSSTSQNLRSIPQGRAGGAEVEAASTEQTGRLAAE